MSDAIKPAWARVQSPCVNVCRMDEHTGLCAGCLRTLDEIADDGQAEAGAGRGLVNTDASPQDRLAHRGRQSRAIVFDGDQDVSSVPRCPHDHARPCPLAGVVEQIAEHLVEVLALRPDREIVRNIDLDRDASIRVEPLKGSG